MDSDNRRSYRRYSVRSQVTPWEIRGLLTDEATSERIPLIIWDLSDAGMCLWVAREIAVDTQVRVTTAKPESITVQGTVRWCRDSEERSGFHLGVEVSEQAKDNLERLQILVKEQEQAASAS